VTLIDLHAHTTASDGSLSPTGLVEAAVDAGLAAIAVTDHDTSDGVPEALKAGRSRDIRVVPGIEISCVLEGGTLHILGYEIDPAEPRFAGGVERLKQAREERNPKIISNLREMGIPITIEEVTERAGGGMVGRPHIAQTLLDLGAVRTVQEAFDRYLASDSPAYVHKFRFEPDVAFELIRGAGGIPVMAHPYQTRRDGDDLRHLVAELKEKGLEGIEVFYSHHSREQTACYQELARAFDLVPTGGTDFHGGTKPDIALGSGKGDLRVPWSVLEGIDERVALIRENRA
jgi:predicted metal-dependent phosphoesterase TrpH